MKLFFRGTLYILLIIFSLITSCNDDPDEEPPQLITEAQLTGLLGEEITIVGENFVANKIQFFFDLEEANITSFSPTEIRIRVPRTLQRYNPVLQIINLETNEDLLKTSFRLKTPQVNGYSGNEITFDEKLIINGENFDIDKDFVEVLINNEKAQVLSVNHNNIEVYIPYKILDANLEVKINAQLQSVISPIDLGLKIPVMEILHNGIIDQYNTILNVSGMNFNPEDQYGEVYLNGVLSEYESNNTLLDIHVPIGPFEEFQITNITYKTAGLTVSFDINIEITTPGIMVDDFSNINGDIIVYNNKAYGFTADLDSEGFGSKIELHEFLLDTQKWSRIESFTFNGHLNEFAFDDNNSIYLYKTIGNNINELTKLNLDDFIETKITIPFHESLNGFAFFSFHNNLYVLHGNTYENGQPINSNKKYIYRSNENIWEEIISSDFSEPIWKKGKIGRRIFVNGKLYFKIGTSGDAYELNSNFDLNTIFGGNILFRYNQKIIGAHSNIVNNRAYMYNLNDINNGVNVQFGHSNFGWFFVLEDVIYYHVYDRGSYYTFRLRNDFLDEIL